MNQREINREEIDSVHCFKIKLGNLWDSKERDHGLISVASDFSDYGKWYILGPNTMRRVAGCCHTVCSVDNYNVTRLLSPESALLLMSSSGFGLGNLRCFIINLLI